MDYGTLADEGGFFLYGFNEEWIYGHSSPHVISLVTDQDFSCLNPGVLEDPLNLAEIHQMQLQVQEAPVIQVQPAPVVLANNYTAEMNFISSLFVASLKYGPPLYASDLAFARWKNTTPYSHRAVNLAKNPAPSPPRPGSGVSAPWGGVSQRKRNAGGKAAQQAGTGT